METTKATTAEGEMVLHLYDLRRETEMRKARNWFAAEFWPRSFSDMEQTMMQFNTPQSHWLRQLLSYWEMAGALVQRGSMHPGLFHDTCGEGWFVYAKIKPFIQECRSKFSPDFLVNLEKIIEGSAEGRERLKRMQEMLANMKNAAEESKSRPSPASHAA